MQKLFAWFEGKIWQLQLTNDVKVGHKEVTSKRNKHWTSGQNLTEKQPFKEQKPQVKEKRLLKITHQWNEWEANKSVTNKQIKSQRNRQVNDVDAYHKQVNNRQVQNKKLRI